MIEVLSQNRLRGSVDLGNYILEQISMHRTVHVVEAETEAEALKIADNADDNWQEFMG